MITLIAIVTIITIIAIIVRTSYAHMSSRIMHTAEHFLLVFLVWGEDVENSLADREALYVLCER